MYLENNRLFVAQNLHGNGGAGLQLSKAFHVFINVFDGLAIDFLNDVSAADAGLVSGLSCNNDIGTKTGNIACSHDIGHQTQRHLKLRMTHLLTAWHVDVIGCLGHSCQTSDQLLREIEGLLHAIVIQG